MNRTDRLYAIVEELRARAPRAMSRERLAGRFEVSGRTIERDISALQQAGVPIYSTRGPGGGYAIDARTTLPPLNLTAREAVAVAVALAAAGTMPFATDAATAAAKVGAVLAADGVRGIDELASRFRVTRRAGEPGPLLRAVEEAVATRAVVELDYVDGDDRTTTRAVECHGIYGAGSHWYVIGWCRLRGDGRLFRLDRIAALRPTDERAPERDVDAVLGWVPDEVDRPSLTPGEAASDDVVDDNRDVSRRGAAGTGP
ncbi:MAG: YafY family protein [Actinomycetota bacterium]|nr:YafY family protein [Actinomycetota bacterium]